MVMPAFGCFATVLQPTPAVEAAAANPVDEVRLSIVR
jgi:hypothetical protein